MFKKFISVMISAAMLLCFAACTNSDAPETETEPVTQAAEEFKPFYIAKENAARIEKSTFVIKHDGADYNVIEYNGVNYIAKVLESGNLHAVYRFDFDFTIQSEATKRAGGKYIYFTKLADDNSISALYAYYIPTGVDMKVVDGPCSNFVLFNIPENFEMYPYGFIVNAATVNVVDLREGSISSYSKDIKDVNIYFETPEYFFSGNTLSTSISTRGKTHILIKMTEKNKKGEVENELSFTFNPIVGVFVKQ